jgi:SAM-dependent methyltransferase
MDLKELQGSGGRRHPWETARANHFLRVLGGAAAAQRVLDVGAGDAFFARSLAQRFSGASVVCLDTNYTDQHLRSLDGAEGRVRYVRAEPEGTFDLILLLDVVEHVPDPRAFLSGLVQRRLAAGGHVLVSVPAWDALYTRHDVALGHYRRYTPAELRALLDLANLDVLASGNIFHSLLLVRALEKLGELVTGRRSRPQQEGFGVADEKTGLAVWRGGRLVTGAISACLEADNRLGALGAGRWRLPGLSTWALCRKR